MDRWNVEERNQTLSGGKEEKEISIYQTRFLFPSVWHRVLLTNHSFGDYTCVPFFFFPFPREGGLRAGGGWDDGDYRKAWKVAGCCILLASRLRPRLIVHTIRSTCMHTRIHASGESLWAGFQPTTSPLPVPVPLSRFIAIIRVIPRRQW